MVRSLSNHSVTSLSEQSSLSAEPSFEQSLSKQTSVLSSTGNFNTLSIHSVPTQAYSWWLFRDDTPSSNIPPKLLENVVGYATLTETFTTHFITNDVTRLRQLLPHEIPHNLLIDQVDYNILPEFSLIGHFAKAGIYKAPYFSKDLLSLLYLYAKGGISFDADIHWKSTHPQHFEIEENKDFITHFASDSYDDDYIENAAIAVSEKSTEKLKPLLEKITQNIIDNFKIEYNSFGIPIAFTLHESENIYDLIDTIYLIDFVDIMQNNNARPLSLYAKYTTPDSIRKNIIIERLP